MGVTAESVGMKRRAESNRRAVLNAMMNNNVRTERAQSLDKMERDQVQCISHAHTLLADGLTVTLHVCGGFCLM